MIRSAVAEPPQDARQPVAAVRRRFRDAAGRDVTWLIVLAASFVLLLLTSWQRWADPIVDIGREMNQPLRLLSGEHLYSDVRHIYGPLSPWLHAGLYRLFGPSLTILYADGIVSATIVLGLVYWLGRRIMDPAATGVATLHVMSLCMFKPAGNYILPYWYNSLHGATLGLITLAMLVMTVKRVNERAMRYREGHGCIRGRRFRRRSRDPRQDRDGCCGNGGGHSGGHAEHVPGCSARTSVRLRFLRSRSCPHHRRVRRHCGAGRLAGARLGQLAAPLQHSPRAGVLQQAGVRAREPRQIARADADRDGESRDAGDDRGCDQRPRRSDETPSRIERSDDRPCRSGRRAVQSMAHGRRRRRPGRRNGHHDRSRSRQGSVLGDAVPAGRVPADAGGNVAPRGPVGRHVGPRPGRLHDLRAGEPRAADSARAERRGLCVVRAADVGRHLHVSLGRSLRGPLPGCACRQRGSHDRS